MSASAASEQNSTMEEIATQAQKARQHLTEAISGLERIIELATKEGRQDIVEEAKKQRFAAINVAKDFNEQVAGKADDELDSEAVSELNERSVQSEHDMRALYEKLEKRVSGVEKKVDDHDKRLGAIEAVLPKDDNGKFMKISDFVDDHVNSAVEKSRQFVNDVAGRVVVSNDQPLRYRGALMAFIGVIVLYTLVRWLIGGVGFWAAFGWWPGFLFAGGIAIFVLMQQNRSSKQSSNSNTAPAVREEGH